ncbi:hypothetical protein [Desulfotalea psychrophila]|uniref:hypothetical protein n=1 Tax=Desulfotalea psychrophila TaxID=84980 RepID=UPI00059D6702|nr:hypothetical protein [Desulfotalea psychrophila]
MKGVELFFTGNPLFAAWIFVLLSGLVVWLWKRDVNNTNSVMKVSLDNNTRALTTLSDKLNGLDARVRSNETAIAEIKVGAQAKSKCDKQQVAGSSAKKG